MPTGKARITFHAIICISRSEMSNELHCYAPLCYYKSMANVIQIDPEIMGGTPVFIGTRVPIETLFDYLEGGEPIDGFLDDFPTVKKDQVLSLLESLKFDALKKIVA